MSFITCAHYFLHTAWNQCSVNTAVLKGFVGVDTQSTTKGATSDAEKC